MVDQNHDEPMFVISVAARLLQVHPQTLRYYERAGLMKPTRSSGKIRLYSQREIDRLRKIQRLTTELGVNLAGAEIVIDLTERLEKLQDTLNRREAELILEIQHLQEQVVELRAMQKR
jgi:MerR family transcriptional regulator/heat shock protein HspR